MGKKGSKIIEKDTRAAPAPKDQTRPSPPGKNPKK